MRLDDHRSVPDRSFRHGRTCRTTKAAVKMHTLLDLRGNIPSCYRTSGGWQAARRCMQPRISRLDRKPEPSTSWIVATSTLPAFRVLPPSRGLRSSPAVPSPNIAGFGPRRLLPAAARRRSTGRSFATRPSPWSGLHTPSQRITRTSAGASASRTPSPGKTLVFITNNFSLPAATICALYKSRWQVELFFKWIKQHLRIKQFYGTSENAVKTQIWIAVSVYVLVAIVKKRLAPGSPRSTLCLSRSSR